MRWIALMTCLFACVVSVAQKSRRDVPLAPLPEAIIGAKKVFLANGGGSGLAFDRPTSQDTLASRRVQEQV